MAADAQGSAHSMTRAQLSLTATTLCALLLVFAVQGPPLSPTLLALSLTRASRAAWQPDDEAIRNAAEDAWLDMDSDERSRYGDDASALASEAKDAIAALGWASTALAATLAAAALVAHQLRRALLHSEQLASAEKESKATYEQRLAARRSEAAKRAEEALRGRQRDYAVRDEDAMDEEKAAEPRGPPLTADNFASLDAVAEAQRRRASASTSASRSPVHSSQKGQEKKKKRKWKGADGRQPLSKVSPHRRGSIGQSSSMASPMAAAAADGTSSHPNSPDAFSAGSPHMPVAMPAPAAPQSPPAQQPPPPAPAPAPAPPIAPAPPQQPRSPGAAAGAPVASRNRRIVFFPASGPA
jgi:hypothetical protein